MPTQDPEPTFFCPLCTLTLRPYRLGKEPQYVGLRCGNDHVWVYHKQVVLHGDDMMDEQRVLFQTLSRRPRRNKA